MNELLETLNTLRQPGEVVEVRIPGTRRRTISGYFDDYSQLSLSIENYIGQHDIYITLNPVKKDLLARYNNRLEAYAKQTTSDPDIERIRYILVDIDPVRPSGISSTKEEKKQGRKLVKTIYRELLNQGFPQAIICDSGNGFHLLYAVDLENSQENIALLKQFLDTLDFLFSTDLVHVDRTTYNPARIVKFYGTMACKGDNTEDRPHRHSRIVKVPDELKEVPVEVLQAFVAKRPQFDDVSTQKKTEGQSSFDVEDFIQEFELDLSHKASFHNKGTKYILGTCPWNEDHTNQSSYIIQFDSGAIAAGCLHNSCRDESWKTLCQLLGVENVKEETGNAGEVQSDTLIRLSDDFQYFKDDLEELYAAVKNQGHWETMDMSKESFKMHLLKLYYEETNSAPNNDALSRALNILKMKAFSSDTVRTLNRRVSEKDGIYYYDLCSPSWRAVKVDTEGCSLVDQTPILFIRSKNMKEQVEPDFSVKASQLLDLVKKHFLFKNEEDALLFTVYLVTCFLPQIAHVILVLYGEKGSAKSTTVQKVKRIVDPAQQDLLSIPSTIQDLAINLSNTYMPCYDNLDALSTDMSDLLCMAATGGAFAKKTLYKNSDETILRFRRCVVLNGINLVATRFDLLDRSIILELERIPKTERKTEKKLWAAFQEDLPKFLGSVFNALSQAISLYDTVELTELGRMADFTHWGYAIAEAIGLRGDSFLEAYLDNQDSANEESLSSHPLAAAVMSLMKDKISFSGSMSSLLNALEDVAETERISTRAKLWPKAANVLSRRLKEVKSNLDDIGISYTIQYDGDRKKITIEKRSFGSSDILDSAFRSGQREMDLLFGKGKTEDRGIQGDSKVD